LEAESELGVLASELSDLSEDEIPLSCSPMVTISYLLAASPMRSFFRISEIYRDVQVLLVGTPGRLAGMLTSCEALDRNSRGTLCEVVAIRNYMETKTKSIYTMLSGLSGKMGLPQEKGLGGYQSQLG
jgi:hypothetical protein